MVDKFFDGKFLLGHVFWISFFPRITGTFERKYPAYELGFKHRNKN